MRLQSIPVSKSSQLTIQISPSMKRRLSTEKKVFSPYSPRAQSNSNQNYTLNQNCAKSRSPIMKLLAVVSMTTAICYSASIMGIFMLGGGKNKINNSTHLSEVLLRNRRNKEKLRPKLILHVGPQIGPHYVEVNTALRVSSDPALQSKKDLRWINFDSMQFDELLKCLVEKRNRCDSWDALRKELENAYEDVMDGNSHFKQAIHSLAAWSFIPQTDYTFSRISTLFEDWDINVVIYHTPLTEQLFDMYAEERQRYKTLFKQDKRMSWRDDYLIEKDGDQETLPDYVRRFYETESMRDTLDTYQMVKKFFKAIYKEGKKRTINITERPTIKPLPCNGDKRLCPDMKRDDWNTDLDLLVVEAFRQNQNLVTIGRRTAAIALKEEMDKSFVRLENLPNICISPQEKEFLWDRSLTIEEMFGDSEIPPDELNAFNKPNAFCSVNAAAALDLESVRNLFNSCKFHNPKLMVMRKNTIPNPKWEELNCQRGKEVEMGTYPNEIFVVHDRPSSK